jgi:hypothetical protein
MKGGTALGSRAMRSSPTYVGSFRTAVRIAAASLAAASATFVATTASAQQYGALGNKGTLAIDQISGFRANSVGGIGYAGLIGFNTQSVSVDDNAPNGQKAGSHTEHFTNFWIAPSADYFIIDHLSLGGVIEIASTSRSLSIDTLNPQTSTTVSEPSTTSFTLLPRIGWMFGITDRFGIWPRLGLGYASQGTARVDPTGINGNATTSETTSGFVFDLDVGFLYRVNENWFLRGAPEISFVPGSHSTTITNGSVTNTTSTNASIFQFGIVGGIGVMWDLL